ncbi:MAG TPA: lysine--tRNA ligase [Thermoanaerobaculia bacterium]|nr:lysine--tRNA ligase [Thermoanaerobaculia bacterium]
MAEQSLRDVRIEKRHLLEKEGVQVHPDRFERTHTLRAIMGLADGTPVRAAGRVGQLRKFGKLTFATLEDFDGHIQIALIRDNLNADPEVSKRRYELFSKSVDRWDFVGVEGEMYHTDKGELTIRVREWVFLGKTLHPPPNKYQGVKDIETNWRKRYLDLVSNEETRERFRIRTKATQAIREFLNDNGFVEVETPILNTQQSGALARPFFSHHNALDMEVVLRIAPETYLKRLVVGGYDRVYEFARCFRNEGLAASHLQEFTMLEFYAAYWNYEDNMSFTENLIRHAIQASVGTLQIERGGHTIDFSQPWPRRRLSELILEHSGIDIDQHKTAESLRAAIFATKVDLDNPDAGRGSLIDQLYKRTARPTLVQPTFIVGHPVDLSPLARRNDTNPDAVDRFQLVVDTWEVINAYSELVDPLDQRQRFEEQAALRTGGDDEAMPLDEDYLTAMEFGMPPISGWGMGIDRFVALLTDVPNLRDVVWFPLMKPATDEEEVAESQSLKVSKEGA